MMQNIEKTKQLTLDFKRWNCKKWDLSKIASLPLNNLLPVVVQDEISKEVLLLAYINQEALAKSLTTKILTLWSTTRNELWVKGATSGNKFQITKIKVNCEQNSLLFFVKKNKHGICHTLNSSGKNRESCFYREIDLTDPTKLHFNQ